MKLKCKIQPYQINATALMVDCFEPGINEELGKKLVHHGPLRVVFRDNGFVSDAVKINVEQIFKQLSPGAEVRVI